MDKSKDNQKTQNIIQTKYNDDDGLLAKQLFSAIHNNKFETLKSLITQGANVNYMEDAALTNAAGSNRLEMVIHLIENGANVHARNDAALFVSSTNGALDVVRYLILEQNCDINLLITHFKKYKADEFSEKVFHWCQNYVKTKNLNDKLHIDLNNKSNTTNNINKI